VGPGGGDAARFFEQGARLLFNVDLKEADAVSPSYDPVAISSAGRGPNAGGHLTKEE
jgi:hypothetical protein